MILPDTIWARIVFMLISLCGLLQGDYQAYLGPPARGRVDTDTAAQQGVVGAGATLLGLGGIAWMVRRRRPSGPGHQASTDFGRWTGVIAALTALGVQSAFDFLWHIPLIPLIGAALAGMVVAGPTTEVTG